MDFLFFIPLLLLTAEVLGGIYLLKQYYSLKGEEEKLVASLDPVELELKKFQYLQDTFKESTTSPEVKKLLGFFQSLTGKIGVKTNLQSMQPQTSSPDQNGLQETAYTLTFTHVTVPQMVHLAFETERQRPYLKTKELRLHEIDQDGTVQSATLTFSYFVRAP